MRFLIGKDKDSEDARTILQERSHRVVKEDGLSYMVTMDFDPVRMNLEIEKGIIKNIYLG